jgi:hypothetical protein
MKRIELKLVKLAAATLLLSGCAQGGRVATGGVQYAAVAPQAVEILFQAPAWSARQIGILASQGAQLASDATTYAELQSQAAKLGADAVVIFSVGQKQYASFPGFATYNGNVFGQGFGNGLQFGAHANGFAVGPQSFVGLNLQGNSLEKSALK